MLLKTILFSVSMLLATVTSLNITVGELHSEILQELKEKPHIWTQDTQLRCPSRVKADVKFFLYNRANMDSPIDFNADRINKEKKVVILIHGWLTSYTTTEIQNLKNAYLQKYDCNVIMVDWSTATMKPYKTSYCHIGVVSQLLSKLLCYLEKKNTIKLDEIHVVGHSTGSHIAGLTGKFIINKCKSKIGRITALDPPGELGSPKLSPTIAEFLDVIHTDIENFGTKKIYGHVDYFVNCGLHQPGCKNIKNVANKNLLADVMCSHMRSIELMTESVSSPNSVAVSCNLCPRYCRPDILTENYRIMGEQTQRTSKTHTFLLPTGDSPPYFKGWSPYTI